MGGSTLAGLDSTMATNDRAWSSWESKQCWNALVAMWSEGSFKSCFERKDEPSSGNTEMEVETIVLRWDGKHGRFSSGFNHEAPNN